MREIHGITKMMKIRYWLCIFCPPLAVLLCCKPFAMFGNILLTLCFWFPGVFHAIIMVHRYEYIYLPSVQKGSSVIKGIVGCRIVGCRPVSPN